MSTVTEEAYIVVGFIDCRLVAIASKAPIIN
jgi:hypothetical protein